MKRVSILAVSLSKLSLYMHSITTHQPPAMISRVFTENTLNSPAYFLNQLTFVTSQTSSVSLVVACLLCFSWSSRCYCSWLWSTTSIRSTRKNSSNDKILSLRSRSEQYWEIVEPEALDLGGGQKFRVNPVGNPSFPKAKSYVTKYSSESFV